MAELEELERAREDRANARRARLTAHVFKLGDEPKSPAEGTPEARIELLVELTRAAWALTGLPWPELPRSQWPMRVRKLGEPA